METSGYIGALLALVVIGIGVAIGLVTCLAVSLLASVGMLSTSVLVGVWTRRTLAGFQALFVQCGIALGAPAGAALAWGVSHVWPMFGADGRVLIAGAMGGAGGGLVIAWLASAAAAGVTRYAWPWLRGRVTVLQRLPA
jgi:hypothetical protein